MRGRGGSLLLAALAPAVLLAVDPAGWRPFGAPTWLAVATLVPAGATLVLARGPVRLALVPVVAAVALVAATALGAALGADGVLAWIGLPERHLGVWTWVLLAVALVAGQALDRRRDGPLLATGLVVAGLGVGAVATAEALGWEPGLLDVTPGRLTGTLGSAAFLGAAGALLLPALVGTALDPTRARPVRATAGAGAALLAVAVVGSGARAAWLGLAVAVAVVGWVRRDSLRSRPRLAAGSGVAAAAVIALVLLLTPAGDRLTGLTDASEPGGRGRLDEWRIATRVLADHPLTGVGPEGYRIAFGAAADEAYERTHGRDPQPDRAHSAPLDVALAGGLPALAAWAVVVGAVLLAACRAIAGPEPWLAGIGAGVVAHHAGSLLLFPTVELDPVAWLLGGVLLTAASGRGLDEPRPVVGEVADARAAPGGPATGRGVIAPSGRPAPGRAAWVVRAPRPVLAALGVLAVVGLVAGATEVVADRRAGTAVDALARGDARAAEQAVAGATRLRPDVLRHHLLAARVAVAADRGIVVALAAVDDALTISPGDPIARRARAALLVDRARATGVPAHTELARDEIDRYLADDPVSAALWGHAGGAALLAGDEEGAERAWRRAEDLAPRDPGPALDLALLHHHAGRTRQATAALDRARQLDPDGPRVAVVSDTIAGRGSAGG